MASNPLAAAATNTDMKWAFPTLENPTIIDLSKTGGQDWWQFRPDEDVIFIGADTTRTLSKLQTDGGRNIVVLGGKYEPAVDSKSATLHFLNLHGSVHVEGVHIDSKNSAQDGIAVAGASGKQPDVTVQNSVIENVHGVSEGIHGDMFQTHGSVGDMRFYNVSGSTNYQGFFIAPQYSPTHGSADFENVNVKWIPGGQAVSYQYWFLDSAQEQAYPITLKNVYTTERDGQRAEEASVWPKGSLGDSTKAVRVGDQITWPGLPYKGAITVGSPAKDFADGSKSGLNFSINAPGVHTGTIGDGSTTAPAPSTGSGGTTTQPTPTADGVEDSGAPTTWINATSATTKVTGTDGNDQLAGVQGQADTGGLAGGRGDDTYIVDKATDKVIELADQGVDTVVSYAPSYTLSANAENLQLGGTGDSRGFGNALANKMTGNDGDNVLLGNGGNDQLAGGKGNDFLNGGTGADVMEGGAGNDTYVVSRATDKVVEKAGEGIDTVKAAQSWTLGAYQENLVLTGTANASGTGTAYGNKITGNDGANVLKGMGGNDVLAGGKGADVLVGGTGNDTFDFNAKSDAGDVIKDFVIGQDTLNITDLLKSVGSTSTQPGTDKLVSLVQNGAHTEVMFKAPDMAQPIKLVTVENVDAHDLQSKMDNWS